jgi:predicted nucleic acid-binding protein
MTLGWLYARVNPAEVKLANAAAQALRQGSAVVPHIWHTEIANSVLVGERRKLISEAQGAVFLANIAPLRIQTDESPAGSRRDIILALARRYSLTAYDATYLELALRHGGTLASFDGDLIKAARSAGCPVFGD